MRALEQAFGDVAGCTVLVQLPRMRLQEAPGQPPEDLPGPRCQRSAKTGDRQVRRNEGKQTFPAVPRAEALCSELSAFPRPARALARASEAAW